MKIKLIPTSNSIVLSVPDSYVGKELEVLIYAQDEVIDGKVKKTGNAAQYKGLFTKEEGERFHQYLKDSK
jgi:hypothetical protein